MWADRPVRPANRGDPRLGCFVVREYSDLLDDGQALATGLARPWMIVFLAPYHYITIISDSAIDFKQGQRIIGSFLGFFQTFLLSFNAAIQKNRTNGIK